MRLDDKLRDGEPIVSFEFSPPRTVEAELAFWSAIEELAALEPAFVSVTCGAGGTTRDLTLAVVRRLARERGLEAVPHVTATGFTRDGLVELLAEARAGGAENVLALRGDPPRGQSTWTRARGRRAELAGADRARRRGRLLRARRRLSRSRTRTRAATRPTSPTCARSSTPACACSSPSCSSTTTTTGASSSARDGIDVPVLPGIIPVTSIAQIERMAALCGARIPKALRRELERRQDDPRAVAELGVAYATAQAAELLADGAPGVHLYTLNRSPATRAIVSALRAHGALPVVIAT